MSVYDEIEIEDLDFDEQTGIFTYPCPCGDKFNITLVIICLFLIFFFRFIVRNKKRNGHC